MQRMLPVALTSSAALALLAAGDAFAAGMGASGGLPPATSMPPARSDMQWAGAFSSGLREGMMVTDSAGAIVGKITRIGRSGGAPAVLVDVGGKTVVVMGSTLSVLGDTATSKQTKEQIQELPEPKPS